MPTLKVTVQVNGRPLRRAFVEHLVLGVGQNEMYMTDDRGRVRNENGDLGINSFTGNADIRILCQNSVVKVLDGNSPGVPLAVNQEKSVVDGSVVNLNTNAEQDDHYAILNRCLLAYDIVFRQFRPFSDAPHPDFPLGRQSSLRATKDRSKRIEVSFPSRFPLGHLAFSEPKSVATGYPLIHIRSRASDGRLFGENGRQAHVDPQLSYRTGSTSRFFPLLVGRKFRMTTSAGLPATSPMGAVGRTKWVAALVPRWRISKRSTTSPRVLLSMSGRLSKVGTLPFCNSRR